MPPGNTQKNQTATVQINLLPKDLKESRKVRFVHNVVRRTSFIVLIVYLFGLGLVFSAILILSRQETSVRDVNTSLVADVEQLKNREGLLETLKNRLKISRSIFAKSAPLPPQGVEEAIKSLPASIVLTGINAEEGGRVVLVGSASNSQALEDFLSILQAKQFSSVSLKNMSFDQSKGYVFSIEIL